MEPEMTEASRSPRSDELFCDEVRQPGRVTSVTAEDETGFELGRSRLGSASEMGSQEFCAGSVESDPVGTPRLRRHQHGPIGSVNK
jgi:hypothetical protein